MLAVDGVDVERLSLTVAFDLERDLALGRAAPQLGPQGVQARDGRTVDRRDAVADAQARGLGRAVVIDAHDPDRAMRAQLESFRSLSASDAQSVSPLRIRLATAGAGDTPASLAGRMATTDRPLEQFLVLNGLERNAKLTPGQRYKIVSE